MFSCFSKLYRLTPWHRQASDIEARNLNHECEGHDRNYGAFEQAGTGQDSKIKIVEVSCAEGKNLLPKNEDHADGGFCIKIVGDRQGRFEDAKGWPETDGSIFGFVKRPGEDRQQTTENRHWHVLQASEPWGRGSNRHGDRQTELRASQETQHHSSSRRTLRGNIKKNK